jgi:hypothetical protein
MGSDIRGRSFKTNKTVLTLIISRNSRLTNMLPSPNEPSRKALSGWENVFAFSDDQQAGLLEECASSRDESLPNQPN